VVYPVGVVHLNRQSEVHNVCIQGVLKTCLSLFFLDRALHALAVPVQTLVALRQERLACFNRVTAIAAGLQRRARHSEPG
jgi:hypothetical protein